MPSPRQSSTFGFFAFPKEAIAKNQKSLILGLRKQKPTIKINY